MRWFISWKPGNYSFLINADEEICDVVRCNVLSSMVINLPILTKK